MWGGRFEMSPSKIMEEINSSIGFDKALARQDIKCSKAHAAMLADASIIKKTDATAILSGLDQIEGEIKKGTFSFDMALEDIHMNIESRLKDIIGEPASRLHTARSRNDQVATDFRLWIREAIDEINILLHGLQLALVKKAEVYAGAIMPGYTHLQPAQPITFGHHLMAYVEMFARDRTRFQDARKRLNECPLGSAALGGTSYPIDRSQTSKALGFERPMSNSLDGVSDRDFVLETLSAATISAIHASRLAEEIILWITPHFNFIQLSDKLTTGSSIMPQKRNPDAAELCRAKVGRIAGALQSLILVMKGLPLAYSKDMQEDKELTFDAIASIKLIISAMTAMIHDIRANEDKMKSAAALGYATATDLADWLVQNLNLPFRDAHHIVGSIVKTAEKKGISLEELTLEEMQKFEPRITKNVYNILSLEKSIKSRTSYGGTAPQNVSKIVKSWRKRLESETNFS
ncbi:MAG: argininosuccinate lyase [Hyphomicrobium sp.]